VTPGEHYGDGEVAPRVAPDFLPYQAGGPYGPHTAWRPLAEADRGYPPPTAGKLVWSGSVEPRFLEVDDLSPTAGAESQLRRGTDEIWIVSIG
jgi:hypothetical protein